MFKRSLLLWITAGLLSGVSSLIMVSIYKEAMFVDFSPVISSMQYIGSCLFGCILASLGFVLATKFVPKFGEIIFNLLFTLLTFASLIGPLMFKFPPDLDVNGIDEITMYFIPFTMTLHFLPALIWFALKPLFIKK